MAGLDVATFTGLGQEGAGPDRVGDLIGAGEAAAVGQAHLATALGIGGGAAVAVELDQSPIEAFVRVGNPGQAIELQHPTAELGIAVATPVFRGPHGPLGFVGLGALGPTVAHHQLGALADLTELTRALQGLGRGDRRGPSQQLPQAAASLSVASFAGDGQPLLHQSPVFTLGVGPLLSQGQADVVAAGLALGQLVAGPKQGPIFLRGRRRLGSGRTRRHAEELQETKAEVSNQGAEGHLLVSVRRAPILMKGDRNHRIWAERGG